MTEHSLPIPRAIPRMTADAARKLQITLGAIWLIDGVLQIQPFMFSRSFVTQIIAPNEANQPGLIAAPIRVVAHLIEPRVALFNLLAITIQVLIGLGLMYRPTVKPALLVSFAWALGVWWIGEGLGGLFTGNASPLTGAPGAALLYVLAGLIVWPRGRSRTAAAGVGGVLGERGARGAWALVWLGFAALWLLPANRAPAAVHDAIANAPSGAHWLANIQATAASAAGGHGLAIALVAAGLSAAVGLSALCARWATLALVLATVIGLVCFVLGEGMGGILTGSGTDPNTGPLIILLAIAIYSLRRNAQPLTWRKARKRERSQTPPAAVLPPSPEVRPATR